MKRIKKHYNYTSLEPFIIIAFWALLFASPLLFGRFEEQIDWGHITIVWLKYLPLLAIFFIKPINFITKTFFC